MTTVNQVWLIQSSLMSRQLMLSGNPPNNAYLHVFANISSIKKLEKVRATNKCLHIMFASISHEFRTPLNAFTNVVDLIKINFEMSQDIIKSNANYNK